MCDQFSTVSFIVKLCSSPKMTSKHFSRKDHFKNRNNYARQVKLHRLNVRKTENGIHLALTINLPLIHCYTFTGMQSKKKLSAAVSCIYKQMCPDSLKRKTKCCIEGFCET